MSRVDIHQVRGYLVHAYTASSLLFIVLGMKWILEERYHLALLAMAITIVIDATDGALARKYRSHETAAGVDGGLLDNIVDFLGYVVLPMLFVLHAEMLLEPTTLFVAFIMFASAFGFSRTTAKLADQGFFVGFPSYWNIVVFYLYMFSSPPAFNTVLVVLLAVLVFIPVRFLYVSRLSSWRAVHLGLGGLWGIACLLVLFLEPGVWRSLFLYGSLVYALFYTGHSLLLDYQARRNSSGHLP